MRTYEPAYLNMKKKIMMMLVKIDNAIFRMALCHVIIMMIITRTIMMLLFKQAMIMLMIGQISIIL